MRARARPDSQGVPYVSDGLMLLLGLLLTVGTGLFVASEFALVNLDRHDLETRRERGDRGLGGTIEALKHTSTHLSSAQLGITLTTLLTGYTFEPAMSRLLGPGLAAIGVPEDVVPAVGGGVGVLLATLMSMILGELVPKNFALAIPLATARAVVPFQRLFTTVAKPLVLLLNTSANRLIESMGIEPKEELSGARSSTELAFLVRHSANAGVLADDEATLLDRTIRFAGYDARGLMTPRVAMIAVHDTDTAADVLEVGARSGRSRLPVIADGPDDIVGLVHVKSAFEVEPTERTAVAAADLMVEPLRVPESMDAAPLLTLLRGRGMQFAVVTDEYGGTAGVVTLEDLVEEIVGELDDEHDRHLPGFARMGSAISFDASWRPDELLDRTGIVVPEAEDRETVAGYVADELDRIPEPGDQVPIAGGTLRVEQMDGARVLRLLFVPEEPGAGGDSEGDDEPEAEDE